MQKAAFSMLKLAKGPHSGGLAGILNQISRRQIFWSANKDTAVPNASSAQATLITMDQQLKIDQYRGRLEDFLLEFDKYEEYLGDAPAELLKDLKSEKLISGKCTVEGTQRYKQRAIQTNASKTEIVDRDVVPQRHFRKPFHVPLELSSVGLGTYIGAPDDQTDFDVYNAIKLMIMSGGINVLDTAINYRCQKGERTIGAALKTLIRKYGQRRDELFISTKNGYIPDDADRGVPATILIQEMLDKNLIQKEDVAAGIHCMHPHYLEHQFEQSRQNLGLESIDLMYIHNAYESQAVTLGNNQVFMDKLKKSFEFYEKKIQDQQLSYYGMATWLCFRAKPEEDKIYLNLQKCVDLAEEVGGKDKHGFKFIQVPMGVAMPEAFSEKWQEYEGPNGQIDLKFLVAVCNLLQMNIIASKPLLEGRVSEVEIPQIKNIKDPVSKHLQLVRSMPIRSLISTLVGMKKIENLKKNFEVIKTEPLTKEEFAKIMQFK